MDKSELGLKIREARIQKGYTQEKLAESAGIGAVYLSEIERGIKMPSLKLFVKIINALDISADYVLRDELSVSKEYVYDEVTEKLAELTPKQRKAAAAIIDAFVATL